MYKPLSNKRSNYIKYALGLVCVVYKIIN